VIALCAASPLAAIEAPPSLDDVIARHLAARGGLERIKAVRTMRMKGKMTVGPGIEVPIVFELKRPASVRLDITFQGSTSTQAYDGTTGWATNPKSDRADPQPMSPRELEDMEEQADMDGPLVDTGAKGHTVELVGQEKLEGRDVYKLKVTLKTGAVRLVYIDALTYLERKTEARRTVDGVESDTETVSSQYDPVRGLVLPHRVQLGMKGEPPTQTIVFETIELDVPLDDARFRRPTARKH